MLPERLAVCQLAPATSIPEWACKGGFFSVTQSAGELSIVLEESGVPDGVRAERGWVALKLQGPFPFSMTGVLASFIDPLAERRIPIFAISTFDTDYVLIPGEHLESALLALEDAGHQRLE